MPAIGWKHPRQYQIGAENVPVRYYRELLEIMTTSRSVTFCYSTSDPEKAGPHIHMFGFRRGLRQRVAEEAPEDPLSVSEVEKQGWKRLYMEYMLLFFNKRGCSVMAHMCTKKGVYLRILSRR